MWVDHKAVLYAELPGRADDESVAIVVAGITDDPPRPISMLIDARPPELRASAVATYRLARHSGLESAAPVALYAPVAAEAWDAITLLLRLNAKSGDGLAVLVAATIEAQTCAIRAALVGSTAYTAGATAVPRPDLLGSEDDGPMSLLRATSSKATTGANR